MLDTHPINIADFQRLARSRTTAATWDFIEGGSEDERTLTANRDAFTRWVLRPQVLAGLSRCDLSVDLLGSRLESPLLVAPMAYQGLAHPDAELATARGVKESRSLMVASSMSNRSLEDIAKALDGPRWFQLYVMRDRELTLALVHRAEEAGYHALVVTVDVPLFGRRERDLRNGFCLPGHLKAGNLPSTSSTPMYDGRAQQSAIAVHANAALEPKLSWHTLSWLQGQTRLPIILKGILTREAALRSVDAGVAGIIVSNHGGRQLDGVPASLDALPEVVDAVGSRCLVLLDGGIRRGTDALKARALGAKAVLVGRPILWGLLAMGAAGVSGVLELLRCEIEHAMLLSGQPSWEEIDASLVSPERTSPRAGCPGGSR